MATAVKKKEDASMKGVILGAASGATIGNLAGPVGIVVGGVVGAVVGVWLFENESVPESKTRKDVQNRVSTPKPKPSTK
jgi:Na+/glutamate symporter